jgi:hypothetical protein
VSGGGGRSEATPRPRRSTMRSTRKRPGARPGASGRQRRLTAPLAMGRAHTLHAHACDLGRTNTHTLRPAAPGVGGGRAPPRDRMNAPLRHPPREHPGKRRRRAVCVGRLGGARRPWRRDCTTAGIIAATLHADDQYNAIQTAPLDSAGRDPYHSMCRPDAAGGEHRAQSWPRRPYGWVKNLQGGHLASAPLPPTPPLHISIHERMQPGPAPPPPARPALHISIYERMQPLSGCPALCFPPGASVSGT